MTGAGMDDRWYNVEEIAEHLGIAAVTVYRWLESEKIPAHRVGKQWRFKVFEVDTWVASGGASSVKKRTTGLVQH